MPFEAEVGPLFLCGISVVSILELVVGCIMLKDLKKVRARLIGHAVSMGIAMAFLIRLFINSRKVDLIQSISNSANLGLFGVAWAISVVFLLSGIHAIVESRE